MKTLTITAARRRFGAMLDFAKREPVLITRKNGAGAVIMSAEVYSRMIGIASFERKRTKGD
ncbi:MAG: type II toxin-antitoxin system Phd/YefM family antitoxin [Candidatus Sulfotelmatobacter sp.]|jgi:prevent-host-death family protein